MKRASLKWTWTGHWQRLRTPTRISSRTTRRTKTHSTTFSKTSTRKCVCTTTRRNKSSMKSIKRRNGRIIWREILASRESAKIPWLQVIQAVKQRTALLVDQGLELASSAVDQPQWWIKTRPAELVLWAQKVSTLLPKFARLYQRLQEMASLIVRLTTSAGLT